MPVHPRIALGLACLAACGTESSDDDTTAVAQVASAFDASGDLARVIVPLEATTGLDGMTPDDARTAQIAAARSAFEQLVPLLQRDCVTATTTPTSVAVTFDQCKIFLGAVTLDGSLTGMIDIDVDGGTTPVAVVTTVSSPGLSATGPLHTRSVSGSFQLVHPIAAGSPVHFEGMVGMTIDGEPAIDLSATADWTVARDAGDGNCVTVTAGADLTGPALAKVAPVSISGDQITVCRNACPSDGTVQLSFGQGKLLKWSYTGAGTALVTGPRGRTFEVALPCAD